ncbi:amylo-alpha-1,6-glucosidase [Terrimonas pollutisoli]|uniref:amylo-alpha-1,6-glucosidase n=1 Tax=Terrimonas pollutisoli TaxID=3034147 RepID=UPI0023ECF822|nr:amylo-alpha-1,6-glucosidase [Terrimonas sp. H1YJ31]
MKFIYDFQKGLEGAEWLETNGLGGWSGSSIIGCNTRRYHGLLVAAIVPPTERMVLLSKLDEIIIVGEERIELGTNLYPDNIIHPKGHQYLSLFSRQIFPEWTYEINGIRLKKAIGMIHGENTIVIRYDVLQAPGSFTMELLPLVAARGYHSLQQAGPQMHWDANFDNGLLHVVPDGKTNLYIQMPGAAYQHSPRWFNQFQYSVEQYRGLDYTEDLFNHGILSISLQEGDSLSIIVSTENPASRNADELMEKERQRRELLLTDQPDDATIKQLVLAADQFIVKRRIQIAESSQVPSMGGDLGEAATIIAGYHWFTDWGRDTMISLPGLCLSTGRYEDARKILLAFAKNTGRGMLPNRFQDNGEEPEYNNVDGTLWYFVATYKYLQATGDNEFILNEILPVLKEIIDWHFKGTRYNIKVDTDGLLYAGEEGQQLTWMDARIGDWVVTPRMGKAVEIQALWYNALKIFAELLRLNQQEHDAIVVNLSAEKAKDSFNRQFWNETGNYLYDVIDENGEPDATLRPNQLLAISLPFALIEGEKARSVLQVVEEKLYTPVGLRSLPAEDVHYIPKYGGDQWHRDSAYHQGTVWSWLLGPYVDAIMSVPEFVGLDGLMGKSKAKKIIADFSYHLAEGCIGSVSEIFDAAPPHHPRGCVAQAWGVAEVLRVIKQYRLYESKMEEAKMKVEVEEV